MIEALPRSTPASHNVDAGGVERFLDAAAAEGLELHSFMLLRRGAVVAEGWWRPYRPDRVHGLHSAAKSWTAAGVGLAVAEGLLSLDDRVVDFFPEDLPEVVGEHLAAMTVRDLLTMRTGHRTGISGGEWRALRSSWIAAFLREPVVEAPGETFMYSSATSYMLSAIVSRVTGERLHDYMKPRLLKPLGIGSLSWDLSPEGINTGGNGISCTTEDLARFGLLHLQEGRWGDRQLLEPEWVRQATRNQVAQAWMGAVDGRRFAARSSDDEKREGYGYQWWMTAHGGYRASGFFGQHCVVLPEQEALIVMTAGLAPGERRLFPLIWEHLLPAFDRAGDAGADARLAARLTGLDLPAIGGAGYSDNAAHVSGRRYLFPPNEDGVEEVVLTFTANRVRFELRDARGVHQVVAGLKAPVEGVTTMTGAMLHHQYEPQSLVVIAEGGWTTPDCLRMKWYFVETAFGDTVSCRFDGDTLIYDRSVNTNYGQLQRPTLVGHQRPVDGAGSCAWNAGS